MQYSIGEVLTPMSVAWTPTITAFSGTITTVTTTRAVLNLVGQFHFLYLDFTITTNGTGAGAINVTLPVTPTKTHQIFGRETALTGLVVVGRIAGVAELRIFDYLGAYPGASGRRFFLNGFFEV